MNAAGPLLAFAAGAAAPAVLERLREHRREPPESLTHQGHLIAR